MPLGEENKIIRRLDGPTGDELYDPTWRDIEATIRVLDGVTRTLVILGVGDPAPHMAIGGGKQGKYILYATFDNVVFYKLADPESGPGQEELVAGGQAGMYQRRNCVSLGMALRAAKTFAQFGTLDSQLMWDSK